MEEAGRDRLVECGVRGVRRRGHRVVVHDCGCRGSDGKNWRSDWFYAKLRKLAEVLSQDLNRCKARKQNGIIGGVYS